MNLTKQLVPYELLSPGYEAVYTGETLSEPLHEAGWPISRHTDPEGKVYLQWSVWTWKPEAGESASSLERQAIDRLQKALGPLDAETRRLRAHIGSLVLCDNGVPATIDALLDGIGRGRLGERTFHTGCWCDSMWWESEGTQPGHTEAMVIIDACLRAYLAGETEQALAACYPDAAGFLQRMYAWLGPRRALLEVQALLLQRMLLPFDYFTGRVQDYSSVDQDSFREGGRGRQLDAQIAQMAGLPDIHANYTPEFRAALQTIVQPDKQSLYRICGALAHGLHGLSDCHHSSFRWIENWIHVIGTLRWEMAPHNSGSERQRLARLLFGYTLGLDSWLLGRSLQFLLLDLGYVDLGFDPRNEIMRVYAYLGQARSPVKTWLAACLWLNLAGGGNPSGMVIQQELNERAESLGIRPRLWMDAIAETNDAG